MAERDGGVSVENKWKLRCAVVEREVATAAAAAAAKSRRRFLQRYRKGEIFLPWLLLLLVLLILLPFYFDVRSFARTLSVYFIYFCATKLCMFRCARSAANGQKAIIHLWAVGNLCSPIYINLCQILEHTRTRTKRHPSLILASCSALALYLSLDLALFGKILRNTHWIIKKNLMALYAR